MLTRSGGAVANQKKTAAVGGVTVSVTPLNRAAAGSATIDFQITMDTHAGALASDMLKVAKLVGEKGAEILPVAAPVIAALPLERLLIIARR
jgi:hypothetical protein